MLLFYFCIMQGIKKVRFKDMRVLIRVDFNVPLDKAQHITDASRIVAAIPTIKHVIDGGGIAILISHLGRPKNKDPKLSLKPVAKKLSQLLNKDVGFSESCIGEKTFSEIRGLQTGEVMLLENLRYHEEEVSGGVKFAEELASLADIYINDAFGTAHRSHASTHTITSFFQKTKFCGFLLEKEISNLNNLLASPDRPFTAIIGGAKVSSKINLILSLLKKVDKIIIGGGMAYTFIKAKGGDVGMSMVEKNKLTLAKHILKSAKEKKVDLVLPIDSVNARSFNNNSPVGTSLICSIPKTKMGLDIGPKSIILFKKHILLSKTILWNGPMGVFEFPKFANGTQSVGEAVCSSTSNGAFSLIGGGDSVAAAKKFGLTKEVSYISTGGGAMLKYLEGKDLPAIKALL